MRTFLIIWLGQLISTVGSYMTQFALSVWIWEQTQSVTALALMGFFTQLARIPVSLVAGIWVDYWDRKSLMILSDGIAALSTGAILLVFLNGHLEIWHLYVYMSLNGMTAQVQQLAYAAGLTLLLSPTQYTRANGLNVGIHYGAAIFAPALAGTLYPEVGVRGIGAIDLVSFALGILTLIWVDLPRLPQDAQTTNAGSSVKQQLLLGIFAIWRQPSLRLLMGISGLFWLFHDLGDALYEPMLLAQTGGDVQVLGTVAASAGIGGVVGTVILSLWGGPRQAFTGLIWGYIGAGLSKIGFSWGRSVKMWIPAQVSSSLHFPLLGSAEKTLWMIHTAPEIQGRVFAANSLLLQGLSALAYLLAGLLGDGSLDHLLSGAERGTTLAFLYGLTALGMLGIGLWGVFISNRIQSPCS